MDYKKHISELFNEYNTSYKGLSTKEAELRLKIFGLNKIKEEKNETIWTHLIKQLKSPLPQILITAGFFSIILHNYTDAAVIFGVIIIDFSVGIIQDYKAQKEIEQIKKLTSPQAIVIRENTEYKINSEDIVPGDIIVLLAGNKIPADTRLFEIKELEIDESTLTGEPIPVVKIDQEVNIDNLPLADQKNMAFTGTVVLHGKGKGIVVKTGIFTELGKIAQEVKSTSKQDTPLQKELSKLGKMAGLIAASFAITAFIIGMLKGLSLILMTMFAISMAVAIIPEGLPVVVTITLAIGLKRMAEKNAIVRELVAVETLGCCNYICSDKTGTITENRMMVVKAFTNSREFMFTGSGYNPEGEIFFNDAKITYDTHLEKLLITSLLCNTSDLYEENNEWISKGDPTETALIVAAKKYGLNKEKLEYQYKLEDETPFSSTRQYMAMLYKNNSEYFLFVKGSPEKILEFTGDKSQILYDQYRKMAKEGLRVLGFGTKRISNGLINNIDIEKEVRENLIFAGYTGMIDPAKKSAIEAINSAQKAGINVVMITGDHLLTGLSIAKEVGIYKTEDKFITGLELEKIQNEILYEYIEDISVYARVSPHHKYKIVNTLQERGNIVAVTGDGINDAPALKKADIGISMGKTGTDVAKEASDMILKDDNFATIFEAVKVGRIIYDNIQKVVYFLLSSTIGMSAVIISSLLLNLPLPFLATQILWVNLVTNGLQDVALAFEPGEKNIEFRQPRNKDESILNWLVIRRLILIGITYSLVTLTIFEYEYTHRKDLVYARTTAMNIIVFLQFFNVYNSRSLIKSVFKTNPFSNSFLLISIIVALIAQVSVINLPALQYVFHTVSLDLTTWSQTILAGIIIILVVEIDKLFKLPKN